MFVNGCFSSLFPYHTAMNDAFREFISTLLSDPHEREAFFACYSEPLGKSVKIVESKISQPEFFTQAEKE